LCPAGSSISPITVSILSFVTTSGSYSILSTGQPESVFFRFKSIILMSSFFNSSDCNAFVLAMVRIPSILNLSKTVPAKIVWIKKKRKTVRNHKNF